MFTGAGGCSDSVSDIVFVLDSSGSICNNENVETCNNWENMKSFVITLIDRFPIGPTETQVGLVRYANAAESMFFLNTYDNAAELKSAVSAVTYIKTESTNTSGGLWLAGHEQYGFGGYSGPDHGNRAIAADMVILITDGLSIRDNELTIPTAVSVRNLGVEIIVVGITPPGAEDQTSQETRMEEIRLISSPPQTLGTNYFAEIDFNNLDSITDALLTTTCDNIGKGLYIYIYVYVCAVWFCSLHFSFKH